MGNPHAHQTEARFGTTTDGQIPRAARAMKVTDDTPCALLSAAEAAAALRASRLQIGFQPIVSVAGGGVFALEVLARLDHPQLGVLFPDQFIPQLEDGGLVRQLTERVFDAALADYAAHLHDLSLALTLNVPLDLMMHADTVDWLDDRCVAAGLPAHCVIIELTESQPVAWLGSDGIRLLILAMQRLSARGYRLAIDDFGPAMPCRQDLFALPFDVLKLDKAVVIDLAHAGIVEQAVAMSRESGLCVVAEGIETASTWSRMQALGVDYVQGFLVSRPLPARKVAEWLHQWTAPAPTV